MQTLGVVAPGRSPRRGELIGAGGVQPPHTAKSFYGLMGKILGVVTGRSARRCCSN